MEGHPDLEVPMFRTVTLSLLVATFAASTPALATECATAAPVRLHKLGNITLKRGIVGATASMTGAVWSSSRPTNVSTANGCVPDLIVDGPTLTGLPADATPDQLAPTGSVELLAHIVLGRQGDPTGRVVAVVDGVVALSPLSLDTRTETAADGSVRTVATLGLEVMDIAPYRAPAGTQILGFQLDADTAAASGSVFLPDLTFHGVEPDEID